MQVVGPRITLEDYNEGKATDFDLFERRIKEYILAFAKALAEQEHSGIAVLILASSVLQPLGGILPFRRKGGRNNMANFCNGFVRIFPNVPGTDDTWKFAVRVCDLLRNGLFHEAFIKPGLFLTVREAPIAEESGNIVIDPAKFVQAIESTFVQVCDEIRTDSDARAAFEEYWSLKETDHSKRTFGTSSGDAVPAFGTNTFAPAPATTLAPLQRINVIKL